MSAGCAAQIAGAGEPVAAEVATRPPEVDAVTRNAGDGAETGLPAGHLTAEMVAERLARATHRDRVLPSTIRAMASRGQLPAPTSRRWGRRALWSERAIEEWLASRQARHVPADVARRLQRKLRALDEQAHTSGNDARLKEAVRLAHRRGLSFQQIADALVVKGTDRHPTREAVRSRFGAYL